LRDGIVEPPSNAKQSQQAALLRELAFDGGDEFLALLGHLVLCHQMRGSSLGRFSFPIHVSSNFCFFETISFLRGLLNPFSRADDSFFTHKLDFWRRRAQL
jgi:hypothetical protein